MLCLWLLFKFIVKWVVVSYLLIGVVVLLLHTMKEGMTYGRKPLYAVRYVLFSEIAVMYRAYRGPGVIGSIMGAVKTTLGLLVVAVFWPLALGHDEHSDRPYPPSV